MVIDCIPNTTGKTCVNCDWQWKRDTPFPHHNCSRAPDLAPAAVRLGLTLDTIPAGLAQRLAQWQAQDYPERTESERATIAATPCESRRGDKICGATGCSGNGKTIKCELLARLATENCPGRPCLFGDPKTAVRQEIEHAAANW